MVVDRMKNMGRKTRRKTFRLGFEVLLLMVLVLSVG